MAELFDLLLDAHSGERLDMAPDCAVFHTAFHSKALSIAGGLQQRGWRHIAVSLDDAFDLACVLFGAWRAGVQVTLAGDNAPGAVTRLLHTVDAFIGASATSGMQAVDTLMAQALPPGRLDPDSLCLVLATSGSSGAPKMITKSLRQLSNEVAVLESCWGSRVGDAIIIGSVSAQHIYGLLFRVLWPLSAGRVFERMPQATPEELQRCTAHHRRVIWVTSPALLKRVGANLNWDMLAPCVAAVFSSGGSLAPDVAHEIGLRLGERPVEIYGSSETGGVAWRQSNEVWAPFPGVEVGCGDHDALWVRSSYLPVGHTELMADSVRLVPGGFILQERLDRIVKLEEKRVSLPQIESYMRGHEWIDDVRLGVIHSGRAYLGAVVALNVEGVKTLRASGRRFLIRRLREALAADVERLALPRRWRLVLQLPVNAQGKSLQAEIDHRLQAPLSRQPLVQHVTCQDGVVTLSLQIPLDLAHFPGHFAGVPVVPGVVLIGWAIAFAREHLGLTGHFAGMEVIKFQRLLRPGDISRADLRFDSARQKLHFNYRTDVAANASGRILFADNHA